MAVSYTHLKGLCDKSLDISSTAVISCFVSAEKKVSEKRQDSVFQMKAADEEVQRVFKNMTPAVVTQMIKRGIRCV